MPVRSDGRESCAGLVAGTVDRNEGDAEGGGDGAGRSAGESIVVFGGVGAAVDGDDEGQVRRGGRSLRG